MSSSVNQLKSEVTAIIHKYFDKYVLTNKFRKIKKYFEKKMTSFKRFFKLIELYYNSTNRIFKKLLVTYPNLTTKIHMSLHNEFSIPVFSHNIHFKNGKITNSLDHSMIDKLYIKLLHSKHINNENLIEITDHNLISKLHSIHSAYKSTKQVDPTWYHFIPNIHTHHSCRGIGSSVAVSVSTPIVILAGGTGVSGGNSVNGRNPGNGGPGSSLLAIGGNGRFYTQVTDNSQNGQGTLKNILFNDTQNYYSLYYGCGGGGAIGFTENNSSTVFAIPTSTSSVAGNGNELLLGYGAILSTYEWAVSPPVAGWNGNNGYYTPTKLITPSSLSNPTKLYYGIGGGGGSGGWNQSDIVGQEGIKAMGGYGGISQGVFIIYWNSITDSTFNISATGYNIILSTNFNDNTHINSSDGVLIFNQVTSSQQVTITASSTTIINFIAIAAGGGGGNGGYSSNPSNGVTTYPGGSGGGGGAGNILTGTLSTGTFNILITSAELTIEVGSQEKVFLCPIAYMNYANISPTNSYSNYLGATLTVPNVNSTNSTCYVGTTSYNCTIVSTTTSTAIVQITNLPSINKQNITTLELIPIISVNPIASTSVPFYPSAIQSTTNLNQVIVEVAYGENNSLTWGLQNFTLLIFAQFPAVPTNVQVSTGTGTASGTSTATSIYNYPTPKTPLYPDISLFNTVPIALMNYQNSNNFFSYNCSYNNGVVTITNLPGTGPVILFGCISTVYTGTYGSGYNGTFLGSYMNCTQLSNNQLSVCGLTNCNNASKGAQGVLILPGSSNNIGFYLVVYCLYYSSSVPSIDDENTIGIQSSNINYQRICNSTNITSSSETNVISTSITSTNIPSSSTKVNIIPATSSTNSVTTPATLLSTQLYPLYSNYKLVSGISAPCPIASCNFNVSSINATVTGLSQYSTYNCTLNILNNYNIVLFITSIPDNYYPYTTLVPIASTGSTALTGKANNIFMDVIQNQNNLVPYVSIYLQYEFKSNLLSSNPVNIEIFGIPTGESSKSYNN